MNGVIVVDKPADWTSHDVVLHLRRILRIKKIGHTGTLDPLATGVLLITIGQATKLFPYLSRMDKTYSGEVRFGQATETYDSQGGPIGPECSDFPEEKDLRKISESFKGEIIQIPPSFSAKKVNGQPAFKLARQGLTPNLSPIKVKIYRFLIIEYQPPVLKFLIECSSGTYIRTLAHDLGQKLGCGAHLSQLRRLAVGKYTEEEAFNLDQIKEMVDKLEFSKFIIPMENLLPDYPAIWLSEISSKAFLHGSRISLDQVIRASLVRHLPSTEPAYRILSKEGKLLGLANFNQENLFFQPVLVFKT
jgi:tRNA pseudouridine55 synthase